MRKDVMEAVMLICIGVFLFVGGFIALADSTVMPCFFITWGIFGICGGFFELGKASMRKKKRK